MRQIVFCLLFLAGCGGGNSSSADAGPQDEDGDGYDSSADCNDDDPQIHPDADEICDGIDNDCDALIDDDDDSLAEGEVYFVDGDEDGFGTLAGGTRACSAPVNAVTTGGDCNDENPNVHPDAVELCDDIDNDCDTLTDDADDVVDGKIGFYVDADGDGYGNQDAPVEACKAPQGRVADNTDCDDALAVVNPGMPFDFGDTLDNDCDTSLDEDVGTETYTHTANMQAFWDTHCVVCHGNSGGLTLGGDAYEDLVNQPSSAGMPYITPGLPSQSYLWHKLNNTQGLVQGGDGSQMPPTGPLTNPEIEQVRTWIIEGAPL